MKPLDELKAGLADPETLGGVKQALAQTMKLSQPASREEIVMELEALATHHPHQDRDEVGWKLWANAWVQDLTGVPADILRSACVQWRRNDDAFMPKPGKLLRLIEPIVAARNGILQRGERVVQDMEKSAD